MQNAGRTAERSMNISFDCLLIDLWVKDFHVESYINDLTPRRKLCAFNKLWTIFQSLYSSFQDGNGPSLTPLNRQPCQKADVKRIMNQDRRKVSSSKEANLSVISLLLDPSDSL